mmetsp:Transcript_29706/g.86574  ORF Transcript_29706/g.86574 Transcript_29706/m.86574 type:complete len:383 (+) Transcript_29706:2224-3372(+)
MNGLEFRAALVMEVLEKEDRPLPNPPRRQGLSGGSGAGSSSHLLVPRPLGPSDRPARRTLVVGAAAPRGLVLSLQHLDEPGGVVLVQYLQRADGVGTARAGANGTAAPQLVLLLPRPRAGQTGILLQQRPQHAGVGPSGALVVVLDAPPDAVAHNVQVERRQSVLGQYRGTVGTVREDEPHQLLAFVEDAVGIPKDALVDRGASSRRKSRVSRVHRPGVAHILGHLRLLVGRGDVTGIGQRGVAVRPTSGNGGVGIGDQQSPDAAHRGRDLDPPGPGHLGPAGIAQPGRRLAAPAVRHVRGGRPADDGEVEGGEAVGRVGVPGLLGVRLRPARHDVPPADERRLVQFRYVLPEGGRRHDGAGIVRRRRRRIDHITHRIVPPA